MRSPPILEFIHGDITEQDTTAIVNAANASLRGGGGVDGAIHRAGGPEILRQCLELGGCAPGDAKITGGGLLRARWVIHTVGPIYRDGGSGESEILASAYRRSLEVAAENGVDSIAFPSISTGAYGYPLEEAAAIAVRAVRETAPSHPLVRLVRFVLFSPRDLEVYERAFERCRGE